MDFAVTYLMHQKNALQKWREAAVIASSDLREFERPDDLTPFSGTHFYQQLSETEKTKLYDGFLQMTAEAFIVFEQMLLKSNQVIQKKYKRDLRTQAMKAFALEEFYHLRAYRQFLNESRTGFWPESLISRQSHGLKFIYAWLLEMEPLCILIPGAKSEVFSLQYTKYLRKCFGTQSTSWSELNIKHAMDEVHHVGFDFNFFNSYVSSMSLVFKIRVWLFTFIMIVAIQFIVLISGVRLMRLSFGDRSIVSRYALTFRFFQWAVNRFEPYRLAKIQFGTFLGRRPFIGSKFFRFMAW